MFLSRISVLCIAALAMFLAGCSARPTSEVLTPVVSQIGLIVIGTLNNSILIEKVFGLPGLGRLTESAIKDSDYPVILAIVLIFSVVVMLSNLLVDIAYPLLDPRAASKKKGEE